MPGLTRDRQYGIGRCGPRPYVVVDTGGLTDEAEGLAGLVARQAWWAIEEADAVLLVDGRSGLIAADEVPVLIIGAMMCKLVHVAFGVLKWG